jgi:hypothetical protein
MKAHTPGIDETIGHPLSLNTHASAAEGTLEKKLLDPTT